MSSSLSFAVGQKLGRYELLAPIARGGMGQVWVARLRGARGFHKLVAIKTLICTSGDEARMERMLLEEARIASLIQHSNVAQTLELGEHDGALYLVLEWVDGESLGDVLGCAERSGGVPFLVAVNLIGQTLRGLQAAHDLVDDRGRPLSVVHRDVSPHNVLVTYSGIVKLVDFGIAQAENQPLLAGDAGMVHGKFPYMAPEQIMGGRVDQRTDLFAVGILLYLLTTGRHPFKDDHADVIQNIMSEEPALRPSLLKKTYSRTLEAVVMKALDKDRDRRWHSAGEMRLALERGVPQAFTLGFEAELRLFMANTVGQRAIAKRDTLHRAELAADAFLKENALLVDAGAALSVGSLRAILIDPGAPREVESTPPRRRVLTLRPTPPFRRSARRSWWPVLVLGAALSVAALFLLALRSPANTPSAAAPNSPMVDLTPPRTMGTIGQMTSPSASAPALPRASAASARTASAPPGPIAKQR